MKHNTSNNNIIEMHMLRDEIRMLRNEMRNRFDILEKKIVNNNTNCNSSDAGSGIDKSSVSRGIVEECGVGSTTFSCIIKRGRIS